MTTFAVTNSDQLLPAVNYLLSNLDTTGGSGNVVLPGNVLVANTTTGVISQEGNATPFGYLYQYVNLRYSNNATGTAGFDTNSNNYSYFGVYNSANSAPSANPSAYQWYEVSPPFDSGTSRTLYYSSIGGRQIQWAAASSPPSTSYQVTVANVAIDLDVVTTATGTPGDRGPIAMAYVITTADPNGASDIQLTGWFSAPRDATSPPIGTGLTPVVGDTAMFTYTGGNAQPTATLTYNGSTWLTANAQVINGNVIIPDSLSGNVIIGNTITGAKIAGNTITSNNIAGNTIVANNIATGTITATQIAGNTIVANNIAAGTVTSDKIAANTITSNNIATGTITAVNIAANTITGNNIAGNTITGNLIAANTIVGSKIVTGTITGNLIAANTITGNLIAANTITGNNISANTITATQISTAYLYTGNIISTGANIANANSAGYWLNYNTGSARFGGNISIGNNANIGNNLTIGNNTSIGGNLNVSGLITGTILNANTVQTTTMQYNAVSTAYYAVNTAYAITPTAKNAAYSLWGAYDVGIPYTDPNQIIYMNGSITGSLLPTTSGASPLVRVESILSVKNLGGFTVASYVQQNFLNPYSTSWTQGRFALPWAGFNFSSAQGLVLGTTYYFTVTIGFYTVGVPPPGDFQSSSIAYAFTFQNLKR